MDDNKKKTKRKGNPNWVKGGKSPNPAGRGPDDSSMRAAYEWALSLTPEVVAEILSINGTNDLARQYKIMPRGVQLKLLVALRIVSSVMFEPSPGLVNHVVDRIDGPIAEKIEQSGGLTIKVEYPDDPTPEITHSATDDQATG